MFQYRVDQILEKVEGALSVTYDITSHGYTEEHDTYLCQLMVITQNCGLVFDADKCDLKTESVMFSGCLYDCNAVCPDPAKINDISDRPWQTDVYDLLELGGSPYMLVASMCLKVQFVHKPLHLELAPMLLSPDSRNCLLNTESLISSALRTKPSMLHLHMMTLPETGTLNMSLVRHITYLKWIH